jgi:hypothetical protein
MYAFVSVVSYPNGKPEPQAADIPVPLTRITTSFMRYQGTTIALKSRLVLSLIKVSTSFFVIFGLSNVLSNLFENLFILSKIMPPYIIIKY